MSELDEAWELALAEAQTRAHAAGRRDIADYLSLKRRNDLLRRTGTDWLIDEFVSLAGKANRSGAAIQIERHEEHRFARGSASMLGKGITLRLGVRALTIESGWPRTPKDGIVRGGGLACANIKHFGRARLNQELLLISSPKGSPEWVVMNDDERTRLTETDLQHHIISLTRS
jgi:D-serine deaminase-like pyridoxal phosphate-dependent protein